MDENIRRLKEIVKNSKKIVAFTGAGFSAESGISTYRGAGGLWSKYDPSIYADINYFMRDSTYYWNFYKDERYPILKKAQPNTGHYKLVELEQKEKLYRVITQNIDGLHQKAGLSNVIELHGNSRTSSCMRCKKTYTMDEVYIKLSDKIPPICSCGGHLKPNVVLFGEPLPQHQFDMATFAARYSDTFLVLGSSLVVYPAAQLPIIAKDSGARLIIVNLDPTPLDEIADMVIHKKVSDTLSLII
jgi:NAD-dependent deacetylase